MVLKLKNYLILIILALCLSGCVSVKLMLINSTDTKIGQNIITLNKSYLAYETNPVDYIMSLQNMRTSLIIEKDAKKQSELCDTWLDEIDKLYTLMNEITSGAIDEWDIFVKLSDSNNFITGSINEQNTKLKSKEK
jgi:hypothetical protein